MPFNFSWIEEGVIAGMARPVSSPNELQDLREMGVEAIVSLTHTPLSHPVIEEFGFEYLHLPIADFTPPTLEQVREFIAFVEKMSRANKPVAVHCAAGRGRTGTMLSCWLVNQGRSARQAIAEVRRLRPGSIETDEQERAVHEYEREAKRARQRKKAKKKRKKPKK